MPIHDSRRLAHLRDLLERARHTRVVVIGDVMLDIYLHGDVERISPEAPVPVVRVQHKKYALGGAANVAQNVLATGAACELVAAVGADEGGQRLRDMIASLGGDHRALIAVERCTTLKTRIVARAQQLVRVDEEEDGDLDGEDVQRLMTALHEAVARADVIILEDYNKGVLTPRVIRAAIEAAQRRGIPIVVDPKYRNFFEYHGATIFKPNRRELEAALGAAVDFEHPETLPATLRRLGVAHLLLTLGEQGMILLSANGALVRIPTVAREVYDVVGAGDTVTAYLAAILAAGGSPEDAALVANAAAGVEVGKLGAASVSPEEVLDALERGYDTGTSGG